VFVVNIANQGDNKGGGCFVGMAFSRDKPVGFLPKVEGWVGIFNFRSDCMEVGICWDIV
jgi:hypothetical protein